MAVVVPVGGGDHCGVTLGIHLLGVPWVELDATPQPPPRGQKAWGLLAYLLLAGRPVARSELSGLLFGEAEDPLGALRWSLAQVRRMLGSGAVVGGSAITLQLPPDSLVDLWVLAAGTWVETLAVPGLGRELLEGLHFDGAPGFEAWLLAQRHHAQGLTEGVLHEAALAKLAAGEADQTIALASRLVTLNPFDDNYQELLIRAYGAAGDRMGAGRQLSACIELFQRELGVEPGPAVFEAAVSPTIASAGAVTGRAAARAQLEAGVAAISAGTVDAGLECLRRAAAEAHVCGDLELKARALLALGSALAHAALGRDEEASAALHDAILVATRLDANDIVAEAHRELAWVECLRARFGRALAQIEASRVAGGPSAWLDGLTGTVAYQMGRYGEAVGLLTRALKDVADSGDRRASALGEAEVGVVHLMRHESEPARASLSRSLETARSLAWNAFLPYPEAMLGILDVQEMKLDGAQERLEHAFALGCQLRDCCWEGVAEAGLGLLDEARGDLVAARMHLEDARRRSVREPDAWLWGHAFILDLACAFAVRHELESARMWVTDLESLSARGMMREFLARAYLYRADLGDGQALSNAELVAAQVDNPVLQVRIAQRQAERLPPRSTARQ
jgi:DNA-binding SARP family transcriptional activator